MNVEDIESSFLESLEEKRGRWTEKSSRGKRKQMTVPPGKSIGPEHFQTDISCSSSGSSTGPVIAPETCASKDRAASKLKKAKTVEELASQNRCKRQRIEKSPKKRVDSIAHLDESDDEDDDSNKVIDEYERERRMKKTTLLACWKDQKT